MGKGFQTPILDQGFTNFSAILLKSSLKSIVSIQGAHNCHSHLSHCCIKKLNTNAGLISVVDL